MSALGIGLVACGSLLLPLAAVVARAARIGDLKYALWVWSAIGDLLLSTIGGAMFGDVGLGLTISLLGLAATIPAVIMIERRGITPSE